MERKYPGGTAWLKQLAVEIVSFSPLGLYSDLSQVSHY